ncbi:hypothetical protein BGZ65_006287, partial [Modicella reniformis]
VQERLVSILDNGWYALEEDYLKAIMRHSGIGLMGTLHFFQYWDLVSSCRAKDLDPESPIADFVPGQDTDRILCLRLNGGMAISAKRCLSFIRH